MKQKIILVIVLAVLILLIVFLLYGNDHEDLTDYTVPEVSQITFEELIAEPYVTQGVWDFVRYDLQYQGNSVSGDLSENEDCKIIAQELRQVLKDEPLYTYAGQGNGADYDRQIEEQLGEKKEDMLLYVQLGAGTLPPLSIEKGDIAPTHVRLYALDQSRCYLTIGYRAEGELRSTHYVFYTDDPVLIEELFCFAEQNIEYALT